jgi:hypothetical protein
VHGHLQWRHSLAVVVVLEDVCDRGVDVGDGVEGRDAGWGGEEVVELLVLVRDAVRVPVDGDKGRSALPKGERGAGRVCTGARRGW